MVSVQRRLNSTERKRIKRDRVTIELAPPRDSFSFPVATAQMDLSQLGLDSEASVILEAYFRSSSMRFRCGTIDAPKIPQTMILTDVDRGGAIQFRVLVIAPDSSGRILASAEGLRPLQKSDSPDRQPLLPLRETDIGEELWRVDIDDRNGPWLVINSRASGLAARLRTEVLIQGLILPHALREVLRSLPSEVDGDGDHDWGKDWRKFLEEIDVPVEPDASTEEDARDEWVEEAVRKFTELRRFAALIRSDGAGAEPDHA